MIPISKAPTRITPIELKELKEQLQELLDLGFICSDVSHEVLQSCLWRRKMVLLGYTLITNNRIK